MRKSLVLVIVGFAGWLALPDIIVTMPDRSDFPKPNVGFSITLRTAQAKEKGVFPPFSLAGYKKTWDTPVDSDGDGIKETIITRYTNEAGDTLYRYSRKGRTWAWARKDHDGDRTNVAKTYGIIDSNCDGIFDERLSFHEDAPIPACAK